jgi:hypothetical protein
MMSSWISDISRIPLDMRDDVAGLRATASTSDRYFKLLSLNQCKTGWGGLMRSTTIHSTIVLRGSP